MIEIIFQKKQDAMNLYQHLLASFTYVQEANSILLNEDRNRVLIPVQMCEGSRLEEIKLMFCAFILTSKRDEWLRSILYESYFYQDAGEQDQIIEIIYSVLEGNREELAPFMGGMDEDVLVEHAVNEIFDHKISFSFDSFVLFRLKPYIDRLSSWVEVAIDEYKMEQEYQVFVETLRDFLSARKMQMPHLYVVLGDHATFYKTDFTEMARSELFKAIDRRLLVNHPVYVDSGTIAPLLSIAPRTIFLYTADPQQHLVRTILNIFEERVRICPLKAFAKDRNRFLAIESENIQ